MIIIKTSREFWRLLDTSLGLLKTCSFTFLGVFDNLRLFHIKETSERTNLKDEEIIREIFQNPVNFMLTYQHK